MLKAVIAILLLLPVLFAVIVYLADYQEFTDKLIAFLQLEAKREAISTIYLTESRFRFIQIASLVFAILYLPFWFWSIGKLETWLGTVRQYLAEARSCRQVLEKIWKSLPQQERKWAIFSFLFLTILRVVLSAYYPIQVDEAFSYVFLVNKGSLITASFYPGPNNHVGYLLACSWLNNLLPADWAMRLPSLLSLTIISPLLFLGMRRFLPARWVWLSLLIFSFSEYSLYYSTHGRGYSFQFTCLIMLIFSWLYWCRKSVLNNAKGVHNLPQLLIVLSGALGCYAVPSFIYFLFACGLYAWLYFPKVRKAIFWQSVGIALLTILLYLPILFLNDWATISQNPWVQPLEMSQFLGQFAPYWAEVHGNLLGYERVGWVMMLSVYLASWRFSAQSEEKGIIRFLLFVSLFCYLPSLFQRVLPFTRVFWIKSLADFMLIAWVFLALLNRLKIKQTIQNTLMAGCFLIFLLPACYETGQYLFDSGNYYNQLEATLPKKDFQPNQQILANEDAYAVRIRYLYAQNDWQCQMETAQFKEQVWLILQKSTKLPKAIPIEEYQLLNENEVVWVYKRR